MIKINRLDSGVRIITEEIPYVQSAAVGIWVRAGAIDETALNSGVSHYIEHMMFKGTANRTSRDIPRDIDKIGGQINAFTGKELTCYYVKTPADNFEKGADVLVDMLSNSLLDKVEMNKERKVICEEIKMSKDLPDDVAIDTVTSLVFKGTPLGKSIIGTPTSLNRISRNVMKEYFDNEYTRDSILISVAGNVTGERVISYFRDKFLEKKDSKVAKVHDYLPYEPVHRVIVKDIEQSHICLATKGISLEDKRFYAFSILNNIMGGSMSSRLFQNIREEKGLAYSVCTMNSSFSNDGYFNVYAGVGHDKVKEAVRAIVEELRILEKNGITKDELEISREQLKGNYIFGQESASGRMFAMGKNALLLNRIFTQEEVIKGLENVTMDDIREAEKIICDPESYSSVVVTNRKMSLKNIL